MALRAQREVPAWMMGVASGAACVQLAPSRVACCFSLMCLVGAGSESLRWVERREAWLRVPQTLLPHKGPSTPIPVPQTGFPTPCHYISYGPSPRRHAYRLMHGCLKTVGDRGWRDLSPRPYTQKMKRTLVGSSIRTGYSLLYCHIVTSITIVQHERCKSPVI